MKKSKDFRREPLTDTQLLMTITICIFVGMYLLAMLIFKGGFLHAQQVFDMLNDNASLIIVSCGLTVVMIGRGIDISVGAVTSFVVMSCVLYLNKGGSLFVSVLIALGIGLAFHEGFAKLRETKIVIPWLGYIAKNGKLVPARVELGVVVALCCLLAVFLLLMFHKLGRALYAIGGNPSSALMLGINVKRTRFLSYVISGLLSGISGFVFMMHTGAANATNAAGMEMNAIASSIIGGTLLTGGVGNVIGTFFGTMTLTTIKKIVVSSGLNAPWWQSITTGGMLCFFILLQSVVLSQRARKKKA